MIPDHGSPSKSSRFAAAALLTLALATSGCSIASGYRIADGAQMSRGYRSVAGSVQVGRDATIHGARTVAGGIDVEDGATTRSLSSVAGDIRIGGSVKVDGDVSTVAGEIRIGPGTHVTGNVSTTAGAIVLDGCRVEGRVKLTKGSIRIRGAAVLPGGLVVRHTNQGDDEPTKVDIGPGADVASVEVEPEAEVDLRISREARVGKVTGATATYH